MYLHELIIQMYRVSFRISLLFQGRNDRDDKIEGSRASFYRNLWKEAGELVGASFREIDRDIIEFETPRYHLKVMKNRTSLDDPVTLIVAGDKPLVYRLLLENGLPVPKHLRFHRGDAGNAFRFLEEVGGPCVVKPATGTGGGEGITTGIMTWRHLAKAIGHASAFKDDVLIEEEVSGENYRLLFLDGVLLDAVKRNPPHVIGDGKSSIRQLVERENRERREKGIFRAKRLVRVDSDMQHTLLRAGHTLRSVPGTGEVVFLKKVINDNRGEDNEPATTLLCPPLIEEGAKAVRAVGARLAGVDVITPDPSLPLSLAKGVIIDINTTPGFYCHYMRKGGPFPVAEAILRRLESMAPGL